MDIDDTANFLALRQQIGDRAQRLYLLGEWKLAAQLLLELTGAALPDNPETRDQAIHA